MITIRQAMNKILSACDGAVNQDGIGFNGMDSRFAREMSQKLSWTPKMERSVHKMMQKYKSQLAQNGIVYVDLYWEYQPDNEDSTDHLGNVIAGLKKLVKKVEKEKVQPLRSKRGSMTVEYDGKHFFFYASIEFREEASSIPLAKWDKERRYWKYPRNLGVVESLATWSKSKLIHMDAKTITGCLEIITETQSNQLMDGNLQEAMQRIQEIKDTQVMDITAPLLYENLHNNDMYNHQKRAFAIGMAIDSSGSLMEMGTGKTIPAVGVSGQRYLNGQVKKLLIICPKSVIPVWPKEYDRFAGFDYSITMLRRRSKFKGMPEYVEGTGLQILVMTYNSTWETDDGGRVIPYQMLVDWDPDMIILDESHNIKNGRSNQAKAIHRLGDRARYKQILTGTPVSESPMDIWSQGRFLYPQIFGYKFSQFRDQHAVMGDYSQVKRLKKGSPEIIANMIHSISYRVTKKDSGLNLPKTTDEYRYCELSPATRKIYDAMEEEFIVEWEEGAEFVSAPIVITQMLRLQQIAGGFVPTVIMDEHTDNLIKSVRQVGTDKLEVMREIFEELPKGKKLVIFCRFLPEIDAIVAMSEKMGFVTDSIRGKKKNRGEAVEKFQTGDTQIMVIQIRTGGVGITLTAANTAVIYSTSHSSLDYEQAKARLDRIGQTDPVTFIHVIAEGTIDELIIESLKEKKSMAELVMDAVRTITQRGGSNMGKPKIVDENPAIANRLQKLKESIEKGEVPNMDVQDVPDDEDGEEVNMTITVTKGGQQVFSTSGDKGSGKEKPIKEKRDRSSSAPKNDGPVITIKDLADELDLDATQLRKLLRGSDIEKPSGRWEWDPAHPDLVKIRKMGEAG